MQQQRCGEEAMDTAPMVRPPPSVAASSTGGGGGTTSRPPAAAVVVAMDESDDAVASGRAAQPCGGGDVAARQSAPPSDQFPPQPSLGRVSFQPVAGFAAAALSCHRHVISQQPFSASVGGVPVVPSMPVTVPCYSVRPLAPPPPTQPPYVYYRPSDGFCVTTSTAAARHEPQYGSEHL